MEMKKLLICTILILSLTQGCSKNKMEKTDEKVTIKELRKGSHDQAVANKIEEEVFAEPDDRKPQLESVRTTDAKQPLQKEKFKLDDDSFDWFDASEKQVAVAIVTNDKDDKITHSIVEGAHMALIDHKLPVKIEVIEMGKGVEDMECQMNKFDDKKYDLMITALSRPQEIFLSDYLEQIGKKSSFVSLNQSHGSESRSCVIRPHDQIKKALENKENAEVVYMILPLSEDEKDFKIDGVQILQYGVKDPQQTGDDLQKIAERIKENNKKSLVIFSEANWKLQKFMSNLESLAMNDKVHVVLSPFYKLDKVMQTQAEIKHKFWNLSIVSVEDSDFIKSFFRHYQKRPVYASFWAYNVLSEMKDQDNLQNFSCKNKLNFLKRKNANYHS